MSGIQDVGDRLAQLRELRGRVDAEIQRLDPAPVVDVLEKSEEATPDQIRAWAVTQGIPVGVRGRISKNLREKYLAEAGA